MTSRSNHADPSATAVGDGDGTAIRLGIAGLGLAGSMMIRLAIVRPKFELCAAADPLPHPRDAFARDFGARVYAGFRELCEDPAVEAIYIASPHQFHADQAIMATAHGKHVLVEKPLALTLADCDRVIEAVERNDLNFIVGHTHAFDPNIRFIAQLVRSGEVGRLGMILAFNYTDFLYRPRRPEEWNREMLVERTNSGLARTVANGTKLGRKSVLTPSVKINILDAKENGLSVRKIANEVGINRGAVQRFLQVA